VSRALEENNLVRGKVNGIVSRLETYQATFQERTKVLRNFFVGRERAISLAYLFGSAAKDRTGPMSDLDIGVLYHGEVDWDCHYELAQVVQGLLGVEKVDLVVLNTAPVELAYTCIGEGILLYAESRLVLVEFETRVLDLYGDFLPILRRQKAEILESDNGRATRRYHKALGETERLLREIGAPSREEQRGF
jgi:predicted nucleotidyltransferase